MGVGVGDGVRLALDVGVDVGVEVAVWLGLASVVGLTPVTAVEDAAADGELLASTSA